MDWGPVKVPRKVGLEGVPGVAFGWWRRREKRQHGRSWVGREAGGIPAAGLSQVAADTGALTLQHLHPCPIVGPHGITLYGNLSKHR